MILAAGLTLAQAPAPSTNTTQLEELEQLDYPLAITEFWQGSYQENGYQIPGWIEISNATTKIPIGNLDSLTLTNISFTSNYKDFSGPPEEIPDLVFGENPSTPRPSIIILLIHPD